jgi:hypothetical protein
MIKTDKWEFAGRLDIEMRNDDRFIYVGDESVLSILLSLNKKNVMITIETEEA